MTGHGLALALIIAYAVIVMSLELIFYNANGQKGMQWGVRKGMKNDYYDED